MAVAMPIHVAWLATNQCNARCMHCSSDSGQLADRELTTREVFTLFDELADCGVLDIAISGGEPLLRNDILDVIEYAKARRFTVGIGSNGSTIARAIVAELRRVNVDRLQVSLDGFANAHDSMRRWPGLFNRATKAISLALQQGLRTHVCCTINRLNVGSLVQFTRFVAELGARRLNYSRFIPTGRGDDTLDLSQREWRDAVLTVQTLAGDYRGYLDIVSHLAQQVLLDSKLGDVEVFKGCGAATTQACVSSQGEVFPCVLLPVSIGNVRTESFRTLWQKSSVIEAIQSRSALSGKCGSCSLRRQCGGCRAVAYAKTGDFLAADPRCWV